MPGTKHYVLRPVWRTKLGEMRIGEFSEGGAVFTCVFSIYLIEGDISNLYIIS